MIQNKICEFITIEENVQAEFIEKKSKFISNHVLLKTPIIFVSIP